MNRTDIWNRKHAAFLSCKKQHRPKHLQKPSTTTGGRPAAWISTVTGPLLSKDSKALCRLNADLRYINSFAIGRGVKQLPPGHMQQQISTPSNHWNIFRGWNGCCAQIPFVHLSIFTTYLYHCFKILPK